MFVLLLPVLLSSSALSDSRLPFRLVFRGACVHKSLSAADLGSIAQRLAEASRLFQGPSGTYVGDLHEVSAAAYMCPALSTTAVHIAT